MNNRKFRKKPIVIEAYKKKGGEKKMEKVKHVAWKYQKEENWTETGGRLRVYQEDVVEYIGDVKLQHTKIEMDYIFGVAPPAELLYELLRALDLADFKPELERKPYLIKRQERMSGACDYLKRVLYNKKFLDAPITAKLHVSMYDKLDERINNYVNDLLLFIEKFPEVFGKNLKFYNLKLEVLEEYNLYQLSDFIYPQHE